MRSRAAKYDADCAAYPKAPIANAATTLRRGRGPNPPRHLTMRSMTIAATANRTSRRSPTVTPSS